MPTQHRSSGWSYTRPALRPARLEDAAALGALIESLPAHDRRLRFHGAVNGLDEGALRRWAAPDPAHAFALVAAVDRDGRETLVADARYAIDASGDAAEIGLLVSPAWRGRGVGARCIDALRLAAHRAGVRWLYGSVLAENAPMLALLRRRGFTLARGRVHRGLIIAEQRVDVSMTKRIRRPAAQVLDRLARPLRQMACAA